MGGHAFHRLATPRISVKLYRVVKERTLENLQKLFHKVVVPREIPEKTSFGDVDFLVAEPIDGNYNFYHMAALIKSELGTQHGFIGKLIPDVMYMAVQARGRDFWIQIDVKFCWIPDLFAWNTFQLAYATLGKTIGSMVKPLGLTLDEDGLHIRVEEVECSDWAGSTIFLTKDPAEMMALVRLKVKDFDHFQFVDQLYGWLARSWVFTPKHSADRLTNPEFYKRLFNHSPHWVHFVTEWLPAQYKRQKITSENESTISSLARLRTLLREVVFKAYSNVQPVYERKTTVHLRNVTEQRLKLLIMAATHHGRNEIHPSIWNSRLQALIGNLNNLLVRNEQESTPASLNVALTSTPALANSPSSSQCTSLVSISFSSDDFDLSSGDESVTLVSSLSTIPSSPTAEAIVGYETTTSPPTSLEISHLPPHNVSIEAKLLCLARWTAFTPGGEPCILSKPKEKFEMWRIDSGANQEVLARWAREN